MTVELPAGVEHGTPEGFAAGCKREKDCPALLTHGMCCLYAHLRSSNDVRYYKAKTRDSRPAAIARALGIKPPALAEVAKEAALDEKRAAPKPPTPKPAQPLAERAQQDTAPQEDAGAPVVEEETTAAIADPLVEVEAMGHPTTPEPEEIPVPEPTPEPQPAPKRAPTPARKVTDQERARDELMATAKGRAAVREWGRKNGFDVGVKGRISGGVVAAYLKSKAGKGALTAAAADIFRDKRDRAAAEADSMKTETPAGPTTIESKPLPAPEFSEALEQVRDRVDAPAPDPRLTAEPAMPGRSEWADITIPEDIESARRIAVRLEQELAEAERLSAAVVRERDEARSALVLTLQKWAAAQARADRATTALARVLRMRKSERALAELGAAQRDTELQFLRLENAALRLPRRRWWNRNAR